MADDSTPTDSDLDGTALKKRVARRRRAIKTGQDPDFSGVEDGPHVPPAGHLDYRLASDLLYTWRELYRQRDKSDEWLVERITDLALGLDTKARQAVHERDTGVPGGMPAGRDDE